MKITPDQFKEIMRYFDAGDYESRKKAIDMLYAGFSTHFIKKIKREFFYDSYDEETAEDILHDVFHSLCKKRTKPSAAFAISAWLDKYVFNVARDNLKKAYRHKEFSYHTETKSDDDAISSVVDEANSKDSMMIAECIKQVMEETQKDYPEKMELFTKVKLEGESYSDLTYIYGKTASNLKKIVSEMNTMLKVLIQPCIERAN